MLINCLPNTKYLNKYYNLCKTMIDLIKEKVVGMVGSISGITSILGSYQVCHNLCIIIISLLSIIGIAVAGMPLMFLTKVAIPFWIAAVIFLIITFVIHLRKKCISNRIIIFNSGLIIAGISFQSIQQYNLIFWSLGGILVFSTLILYVKDKIFKK